MTLDGIRNIPIKGIETTNVADQPAFASVEIVPTKSAFYILPHTQICVFYNETIQAGYERKLLFAGEVTNLGFVKRKGVHHASLQCMDFTQYWDQLKHEQLSLQGENAFVSEITHLGCTKDGGLIRQAFTVPGGTFGSEISQFFNPDKEGDNFNTAFKKFLDHFANFKEESGFFATASNKNRFTEQVFTHKGDNTANKLMDAATIKAFIEGQMQHLGSIVSFRKLINFILAQLKYSYCSVLAPPYRNAGYGKERIITTAFLPKLLFAAVPSFNVLMPGMYEGLTFNKPLQNLVTRYAMRTPPFISSGNESKLLWLESVAPPSYSRARQAALGKSRAEQQIFKGLDHIDHEKYSGIGLTVESASPILNLIGLELNDYESQAKEGDFERYLALTADFNFFDYRFRDRSLVIEGIFNPYLVANLPGAVLVRIGNFSFVFVGFIQSITHSINAEGFSGTRVVMSHVRFRDESLKTGGPNGPDEDRPKEAVFWSDAYKYIGGGIDATYKSLFGDEVYAISDVSTIGTKHKGSSLEKTRAYAKRSITLETEARGFFRWDKFVKSKVLNRENIAQNYRNELDKVGIYPK